jgi:hypothetical protein
VLHNRLALLHLIELSASVIVAALGSVIGFIAYKHRAEIKRAEMRIRQAASLQELVRQGRENAIADQNLPGRSAP